MASISALINDVFEHAPIFGFGVLVVIVALAHLFWGLLI